MPHVLATALPVTTGRRTSTFQVLRSLCAVVATSLLLACGGGNHDDDVASENAFKPGSQFLVESLLPDGQMKVERYLVHGVTTQGELVADQRADLIGGALVPLLESETSSGKVTGKATTFKASEPAALLTQQRAFYKQAWDAMVQIQGRNDPKATFEELDDMDARIVDFMDDAAASGVTLTEYLAFYERLDSIPELARMTYAELNLQEALASVDKVSMFEENPPACPTSLVRVVSASGLSGYCRSAQLNVKSAVPTDMPRVSNVRELMESDNVEDLILRITIARTKFLEEKLGEQMKEIEQRNAELTHLARDAARLRDDLGGKPADCQSDRVCVEKWRLGQIRLAEYKAMMDAVQSTSQLNMLRFQSHHSKLNESIENLSSLIKKIQDTRAGIVTKIR